MWEVSILADFRTMGCNLSCCGSPWSGKNFLFKSSLRHYTVGEEHILKQTLIQFSNSW